MEERNNIRQLNIENTISQAWALTKKHLPIFLLLTFLMQSVGGIPQSVYYSEYMKAIMESGTMITEEQWLEMADPATLISVGIFTILAGILCWLIQIYLTIVGYRLLDDAVKGEKPNLTNRLKDGLRGYGMAFITYISYSFIVCLGVLACILPGVFLAVRLIFTPVIAVLHPERTFSECFSQSWNMTKGHFWKLLIMGIVAILLNILGFICCCVGVLVTSIITYFMLILAYRTLSGETEEKREDFTSENLTIVSE